MACEQRAKTEDEAWDVFMDSQAMDESFFEAMEHRRDGEFLSEREPL